MRFSRSAMLVVGAIALLTAAVRFASAQDVPVLYKSRCQVCHGAEGKGDGPAGKTVNAPDFHSPAVVKTPDSDLFQIIKQGKNKMPSFEGKLTDGQIKQLVVYIRSLK